MIKQNINRPKGHKILKMKKAIQFIVLTCLASWAVAGVAIWLGLHEAKGMLYTVFGAVYMLFPAGCAIILQKVNKEKPFSKNI